jgi:hypothetical protein
MYSFALIFVCFTKKELLDCEKNIFEDLLNTFLDEKTMFARLEQFSNSFRSVEFQKAVNKIMPNVLNPLNTLIGLYQGPNKLIEKRNDKLLDYEGALSDLELKKTNNIGPSTREIVTHVEKTKKDYEALNSQLLEELPKLNKLSMLVLVKCSTHFASINGAFLALIDSSLKQIVKVIFYSFFISSSGSVEKKKLQKSLFAI